jgi:hypothetical protein
MSGSAPAGRHVIGPRYLVASQAKKAEFRGDVPRRLSWTLVTNERGS